MIARRLDQVAGVMENMIIPKRHDSGVAGRPVGCLGEGIEGAPTLMGKFFLRRMLLQLGALTPVETKSAGNLARDRILGVEFQQTWRSGGC